MTGISEKFSLFQVCESNELIQHIKNQGYNNIKILLMTSHHVQGSMRALVSSAKKIKKAETPFGELEDSDLIDKIFEEYGLEKPSTNGYLVACTGSGSINNQLQQQEAIVKSTEQEAIRLLSDTTKQWGVFCDYDARNVLKKTKRRANDLTGVGLGLENTEKLQKQHFASNTAVESPFERLIILNKQMQTSLAALNLGNNDLNSLQQLDQISEAHALALDRASDQWDQLQTDFNEKITSLKTQVDTGRTNLDNLVEDSQTRENELLEEIRKNEAAIKDSLAKIRENAPEENVIANLNAQINSLKSISENFRKEITVGKSHLYNAKLENAELEKQLRSSEAELARLKEMHETSAMDAETFIQNLENKELGPVNRKLKILDMSGIQEHDTSISNSIPESAAQILSHEEKSQNNTEKFDKKSSYVCKPSNFGLQTWNPSTTDITRHIQRALKAANEAQKLGYKPVSIKGMILRSLPQSYDYVESFIGDTAQGDDISPEKFCAEIERILGKKSSTQMQSFLTAQRKTGEDLLAYFTRIVMLYKASSKKDLGTNWETDSTHTMSLYTKMYAACYAEQKSELTRKSESLLDKNELTLPKLREILIDINKISSDKVLNEKPVEINAVSDSKAQVNQVFRKKWEPRKGEQPHERRDKSPAGKGFRKQSRGNCFYCKKPGHWKENCYQFQRRFGKDKGNAREPKTHGSKQ